MESKILMNGLLEVCSDGTIYHFKNGVKKKANITKSVCGTRTYCCMSLNINNKQKHFYVHRLVAEAFVQNVERKLKIIQNKEKIEVRQNKLIEKLKLKKWKKIN